MLVAQQVKLIAWSLVQYIKYTFHFNVTMNFHATNLVFKFEINVCLVNGYPPISSILNPKS